MTGRESRPNVLFVCADDLNAWIGPLGRHPGVHTPHIAALARRGTLFTHAYCTAPHCNPSRTSVFSGLRPTTTGVYHGESLKVSAELVTLPELFRKNGYFAFGAGKVFHGRFDYETATKTLGTSARWLDTHNDPGYWDEFHPCDEEPLPPGRPLNRLVDFRGSEPVSHWYFHFDWGPLPEADAENLPDARVVERALGFLGRPHPAPFFCAVGLYRPHLPWYVPRRFFDLHPLDEVTLPPVRPTDLDDVPPIARDWATRPPDHDLVTRAGQWRHAVQGYLAAASYCDEQIGRLVSGLDAAGLAENTIVVLWGDNGFHLGEKLHWRKFTLWEEATRVPLVVVAPGQSQPGFRCGLPVSLLDLYPTLASLCGLPAPSRLDGESLAPWLAPRSEARVSLPISTWGCGNHSVRSKRWRYTRYVDGSEELYDHRFDPFEWTNLARRVDLASVVATLRQYLAGL